jgi:predicted nucleic acid-binding protein
VIILDTNVLSELMRAKPNAKVVDWVASHPASSLFSTFITEAEIRYGVALVAGGKRKNALEQAVSGMFEEDLAGQILPFCY